MNNKATEPNTTIQGRLQIAENDPYFSNRSQTQSNVDIQIKDPQQRMQDVGKLLKQKLGVDIEELDDWEVYPPSTVSNYVFELFMLINFMRTKPLEFVDKILEEYKIRY